VTLTVPANNVFRVLGFILRKFDIKHYISYNNGEYPTTEYIPS
jgi:hypothetical protein